MLVNGEATAVLRVGRACRRSAEPSFGLVASPCSRVAASIQMTRHVATEVTGEMSPTAAGG